MPTKNPRLLVTLEPATDAVLRRVSALTGSSRSSIARDLLSEGRPVLERLALTLEAAERIKSEIGSEAFDGMRRAQSRIESSVGLALDLFDDATGDLVNLAERVGERRRRRRSSSVLTRSGGDVGGAPTPLSNRGVRSEHKTGKKAAATRVYTKSVRAKSKPEKTGKKGA